MERRCGNERHVDLNRLRPTAHSNRSACRRDRRLSGSDDSGWATIENRSTSRVWVGGMPAIFDAFDPRPDSFLARIKLIHGEVARPGTTARTLFAPGDAPGGPGVAEARRLLDALVLSFPSPMAPNRPSETPRPLRPGAPIGGLGEDHEGPDGGRRGPPSPARSSSADSSLGRRDRRLPDREPDPHPLIPYLRGLRPLSSGRGTPIDRD